MKKILFTLAAISLTATSFSQEEKKEEPKKVEIQKEVKVEMVNGVKTLTVTTQANGETKTETFTGEEADKKLAELDQEAEKVREAAEKDPNKKVKIKKEIKIEEKEGEKEANIEKEVKVEEKNGELTLTIITREKGQEKEEVYTGEAAKKKLKELENENQ